MGEPNSDLTAAMQQVAEVIALETQLENAKDLLRELRTQRDFAMKNAGHWHDKLIRAAVTLEIYSKQPFFTRLFGVGELIEALRLDL